jgi:hypothetical protein
MTNSLRKTGRSIGGEGIGGDSVAVIDCDFVSKVAGFVVASTVGVDIIGVAAGEQTFTADNETVAAAKLTYIAASDQVEVDCDIAGGTVTQADEGVSYYDLTDKDTVDGTTESTTTGQVKLVKFISATLGRFTVVNK